LLGTARELSLIETGVDGCLCLTESGKDLYRNRGFFAWAIGGYGKLLRLLDQAFGSPETLDRSSSIDGQFVALGSDLCSRALMLETFLATIEKLAPRSIADLGCGNAGRLAAVCRRLPQAHGLGIDISASAVAAARGTIDAMGLNNAISILHGNVLDVVEAAPHRDVLSKVDVVCSFMMLHDLFNAQPGSTVVRRLRTAFPNARAFVIADTCLPDEPRMAGQAPIFSLGFELIHAALGTSLFHTSDYERAFADGGLEVEQRIPFGVPNTWLYILRPAMEGADL
jgi:SAM-dependent methyltransferase